MITHYVLKTEQHPDQSLLPCRALCSDYRDTWDDRGELTSGANRMRCERTESASPRASASRVGKRRACCGVVTAVSVA